MMWSSLQEIEASARPIAPSEAPMQQFYGMYIGRPVCPVQSITNTYPNLFCSNSKIGPILCYFAHSLPMRTPCITKRFLERLCFDHGRVDYPQKYTENPRLELSSTYNYTIHRTQVLLQDGLREISFGAPARLPLKRDSNRPMSALRRFYLEQLAS